MTVFPLKSQYLESSDFALSYNKPDHSSCHADREPCSMSDPVQPRGTAHEVRAVVGRD
jgi:hypothetical protein